MSGFKKITLCKTRIFLAFELVYNTYFKYVCPALYEIKCVERIAKPLFKKEGKKEKRRNKEDKAIKSMHLVYASPPFSLPGPS